MTGGLSGQDWKTDYGATAFLADLPASPNQFVAISAGTELVSGRYVLKQVSFVNNNAAAVVLSLYDGQDANGELVGVLGAGAGLAGNMAFGSKGVMLEIGLFVVPSAGPVTGTALMVPLWNYNVTPPSQ